MNQFIDQMECLLDGVSYSIGNVPASIVTTSLEPFTELIMGSSSVLHGLERHFNGYVSNFRWWNKPLSTYAIEAERNRLISPVPSELLAYWKFDEPDDGSVIQYTDSSQFGFIFDPTTFTAAGGTKNFRVEDA